MSNQTSNWICDSLSTLGVNPGDLIFVHGDAGVAAQLPYSRSSSALEELFKAIEDYLGEEGTLVIPSFTYSATKGEVYDPASTQSETGMFSEFFRQRPKVRRSLNTVFSVCATGKLAQEFQNSRVDDCFGQGTAFDLLHEENGLIVTLGFDIRKGVTFTHYVEQKLKVSYRYMKSFTGLIKRDDGKVLKQPITYYVRDTSFRSTCDLGYFGKIALASSRIATAPFGRFPATAIRARDFYKLAERLLSEDEFSLLECFHKNQP